MCGGTSYNSKYSQKQQIVMKFEDKLKSFLIYLSKIHTHTHTHTDIYIYIYIHTHSVCALLCQLAPDIKFLVMCCGLVAIGL